MGRPGPVRVPGTHSAMTSITDFRGAFFFLSNFHVADDGFCVEMAYQAAKTTDPAEQAWVLASPDPRTAKHRGYKVRKRPGWERLRVKVMRSLLRAKFSRPDLREALLATGDAGLVEGNTWGDRFWGQCPLGVGENMLGRLLMELRDALRSGTISENSVGGNHG